MARTGPINIPITLSIRFLSNGNSFEPFSVEDVRIYDVATGTPTPLAIISPDAYGSGIYSVTWDALATSTSLTPGTYYDEWTWTAESGMPSTSQRYSFTLTYAIDTTTTPQTTSTETLPVTQSVACFSRPSWTHRPGITLVEDVGNGMGVNIAWEEARPADYTQQIHYNIYYATTRFDVFAEPKAITTSRVATINIPPGNVYYFAVKAAEFDTDWDITELTQISDNVYQYPTSRTLLNDLPESQDGYYIYVDDVTGYPSNGELLIDQEIIRYSSLDTVNNAFLIDGYNRAITLTQLSTHDAGTDVDLWHGAEDGNTIIRMGTAAWFDVVPQNVDAIGQVNVDVDGYRAANTDNITTDLSASDTNTSDFPNYDYRGYHRPSIQATLSGECVSSYVGGEFDGGRGLFFQDRNLARLDAQLQVTGENIILFRRKWSGKRCKCIGLRREHQRTRCGTCFVPGTLVRTETGYKPIEEILVGEMVLSSDGEFRRVKNVMVNHFDGNLISLQSSVSTNQILVTPEHPILALGGEHQGALNSRRCGPKCNSYIKNGDKASITGDVRQLPSKRWNARIGYNKKRHVVGTFNTYNEAIEELNKYSEENIGIGHKLQWIEAKDLDEKCWLVSKWPKHEKDISTISVPEKHLVSDQPAKQRNGQKVFEVTEEFMWIIGFYLAEGCCNDRRVSFSMHRDEVEFQNKVMNYFTSLGYTANVFSTSENGSVVNVYSTTLANWFPDMFGTKCYNKSIPEVFMKLPANKLRALLNGIYDGDGDKSCNEIGQTSEILALQISEILHKLGEQPLIRKQTSNFLTPKGNKRKVCYINSWPNDTFARKNRKGRWAFGKEILSKTSKKSSNIYYYGKVYNLEVDGNHTYVVNGVVVHNCFGTGFYGGYDRFVNSRAISESFTNTQGYIKARIYPYVDDLKIDSGQGLTTTVELNAWTIVYPTIKDRDIIVRFNEDGTEEFRYECLNVTRNRLLFGESGKQEFKVLRMDKTDVLYTLPVLTL